jgi:stage V sporulation protein B
VAKKSFLSGAIILMAAGLIVKIMGFFYRIYLSNLIGAEGMGLFQLISPVYVLVILTLTSGISIAVSKMVAEESAKRHFVNLRRITFYALLLVVFSGAIVSIIMFLKIDFITEVILKDSRTYYSMLLLLPSIPVIAAASALKGYFYGIQDVTPTALSQIVEQAVKMAIVMFMAEYFLEAGVEYACALATVGMALGEIANLTVVFIIYRLRKKKEPKVRSKYGLMRKRNIIGGLLKIALPVSSNRFIISIMAAAEVILIPRRLVTGGMAYQHSIETYGRLTGMAMPLLFFPSLVTSSIAVTLVPALSEAMSLKNFKSVNYRISKSIQIASILGFIFTALFITYPNQIGDMIYRKESIGEILRTFSLTCIFIYLQQTLLGVLNGLGKQAISLRNSIIGYIIRIMFVYFFIPIYGINSYMWGMVASTACVCILDLYTITKTTGMFLDIRNWILKPGLVCGAMIITGKYIYSFFSIFISKQIYNTLFAVAGYLLIAVALMFITGVLQREEIIRIIGIKRH